MRVRQDADASKRDREMSDRRAIDIYEQLHQAAVRDGRDVNDSEEDDGDEGYVPPVLHKDEVERCDRRAVHHEKELRANRLEALKALRKTPAHDKRSQFERLAVESEVYCGQRSGASAAAQVHARRHADDDEDELGASQTDVSGGRLTTTPPYIKGTLRDYQLEGVNWLLAQQRRCVSSILADEMGLGKTFQTIATLAYTKYSACLKGPHLVVVPKSVLGNWFREFKRWCPTLKVLKFHAPKALRPDMCKAYLKEPMTYDVVVTTYDMILFEKGSFQRVKWHYLVVDEAHKLKNTDSSAHRVMDLLQTRQRLLITGTPLQNDLGELWALLHFLAPELYTDASLFKKWFDTRTGQAEVEAVSRLHTILNAMMIRRLKADVAKCIPPKREIYVACGFTALQRQWYLSVLAREAGQLNKATGSRAVLMNIIMHLRKACNHPYIFPDADETGGLVTDERIVQHSGKMVILDKLLAKLKSDTAGQHKALIFSQMTAMLDIIEDYCIMRGYEYCRIDGNTSGNDRDMQMAEFNNPSSSKFIFLLSTRAGGLGINLQAANHVIIYDSDWNPQADLQAQDRAHRIGQKREVRVYRFVTDGTVEEKIYHRALKKLYLDALVVQQGRHAERKEAGRDELMSMVRFGATDMFKSKGVEVTDADVDALLMSGEEKMTAMQREVMKEQRQTVANFELGVEEANFYEFEGLKFDKAQQSKVLHVALPEPVSVPDLTAYFSQFGEVQKVTLHPDLTAALVTFRMVHEAVAAKDRSKYECAFSTKETTLLVTAEMIDEHWSAGEGRGKREHREAVVEELFVVAEKKKIPAPRLPRKPTFAPWWFANEKRLLEIYEQEVQVTIRNWRRRYDQPGATAANAAASAAVSATVSAGVSPTTNTASPLPPLADDEEEQLAPELAAERDQIMSQAFTDWAHADLTKFVQALCTPGIHKTDYHAISAAMGGTKPPADVERFAAAFWELGPHRLKHFASFEERITRAQKRIEGQRQLIDVCRRRVETCEGDPATELKLPLKPLPFATADLDRLLFLHAYRNGMQADGAAEVVKSMPEYRFDAFVLSRPAEVFEARVKRLMQAVLKEVVGPSDESVGRKRRNRSPAQNADLEATRDGSEVPAAGDDDDAAAA